MQDFEKKWNLLLSIIIPVYNREGTLKRCVDSLLKQINDNVEIVLVDDGSDDNTHQILAEYENDKHITVAYREHGGVSRARNYGLSIAGGKYVTFVDSDDFVGAGYIRTLLEAADGSDLAAFDCWYKIDAKGTVTEEAKRIPVRGRQPAERMYPFLVGQGLNSACGKVFKNEIVRKYGVQFDESMKISEDFIFVMDYLEQCKTVNMCDKITYYYKHNPNGTWRVKPQHMEDLIKAYNKICRFIEIKKVTFEDPVWNLQLVHSRILRHVCSIIVGLHNSGDFTKAKSERLVNSRLYQDVTNEKYDKLKYKLMKELMKGQNWIFLCLVFRLKGIN